MSFAPAVEFGLIAGVFRKMLLDAGLVREREITQQELVAASDVYLINSVRGWMKLKPELDNFSYRVVSEYVTNCRRVINPATFSVRLISAAWMQHRRPKGAASPAKTNDHVSAPVLAGEDKIDQDDLFCRRVNNRKRIMLEDALLILDFALFKNIRVPP